MTTASKPVAQSEALAAKFNKKIEGKFSDTPDADVTARGFLGLRYTRASPDANEISCGKALGDLEGELAGMGMRGPGSKCTTPLPQGALRQLESGSGPGNAPLWLGLGG